MDTASQSRSPQSRRNAYLLTALALLPALAFWLFARVMLWPRLERVWTTTGYAQYTGLSGEAPTPCAPETMITAVRALMMRAPLVLLLLFVVIAAAEFSIPAWPRFRRLALSGVVLICTVAVFILFTLMCISAISLAPVAR